MDGYIYILQVRRLVQMGHRNLLGHATEEYWEVLYRNFSISRPDDSADCIPVSVFGDEMQVFDGLQYCCVNWSSDVALFHSNAMVSKFLTVMIPTTAYVFKGKVNLTIQEAMRVVVRSLKLYREGPLHLVVCALKGDWKWMVQILNAKNTPSSNSVCYKCNATKNLEAPLTDLDSTAVWRSSPLHADDIWWEVPSVAELPGFGLQLFCPDILHTYHLGIGRDVVSSVLVLLLKQGCFPGRNVPQQQF